MGLHRAPGQMQQAGDLGVGVAVGGQPGDAAFAGGEGVRAGTGPGGAAGAALPQGLLREGAQPYRAEPFGALDRLAQASAGVGVLPGGGQRPAVREQRADQFRADLGR